MDVPAGCLLNPVVLVKRVPSDIFVWIFDTYDGNFEDENDFTDIFVLTYDTFD